MQIRIFKKFKGAHLWPSIMNIHLALSTYLSAVSAFVYLRQLLWSLLVVTSLLLDLWGRNIRGWKNLLVCENSKNGVCSNSAKIPKAQKIQNMTRFLSNATKSGIWLRYIFYHPGLQKRFFQTHKFQSKGKGNTDLNDSESTRNYKNLSQTILKYLREAPRKKFVSLFGKNCPNSNGYTHTFTLYL